MGYIRSGQEGEPGFIEDDRAHRKPSGAQKLPESQSEPIRIWLLAPLLWCPYIPAFKFLEAVLQHGPIPFFQDIAPHMDKIILVDADEVLIVGRMVYLAERESIVDDGDSFIFQIADDMHGIEKPRVVKITYRAMLVIGMYD